MGIVISDHNHGLDDNRGAAHAPVERVAICVCTCQRQKMLGFCLRSLNRLRVPEDVEVYVIVIDNDPDCSACEAAAFSTSASPHPSLYLREPRRGISFARNAALDAAHAMGMDWIAFIDDDEVADPDWIAALMAPEYRHVPVLMGRQILIYPDPRPFWSVEREKREQPQGRQLKTAYTNNVRFSIALVEAGLRFNEGLGLMGGEDNEFFSAARQAGFEIRQTQRAITYETVHPERLTYRAQAGRAYWCAASDLRRTVVERGRVRAALAKGHTVPLNLIIGMAEILVSPLFVVAGARAFKRQALCGGKKIAKGMGRAAAALGYLPEPYRRVVGE